jgi:hypothetical protein
MKTLIRVSLVVVAASVFISDPAFVAESHTFSPEERAKIQARIALEIAKSEHNAA